MAKAQHRFKFKLADLASLPTELQLHGEHIRVVFTAIASISEEILRHLDFKLSLPYEEFLVEGLSAALVKKNREWKKSPRRTAADHKSDWSITSVRAVLQYAHEGHKKIEDAYFLLTQEETSKYALCLAEASVSFGSLRYIWKLLELGIFHRVGSISSSIFGAASGGIKSGETRRKQSLIPTPENLRIARQKLVDAGKPPREISAMLAKKYACTTDHIRKVLKRD